MQEQIKRLERVRAAAVRDAARCAKNFMPASAERASKDAAALAWAITALQAQDTILKHEADAADELMRLLGCNPVSFRTDGGAIRLNDVATSFAAVKDWLIGELASREMFRDQCVALGCSRAEVNSLTFSIRDLVERAFGRAAGPSPRRSVTRHPLAAEADRLAGVL